MHLNVWDDAFNIVMLIPRQFIDTVKVNSFYKESYIVKKKLYVFRRLFVTIRYVQPSPSLIYVLYSYVARLFSAAWSI